MKVLIACEESATVREAFTRRGHDAWSCDLYPSRIPGKHIQGDVLEVLGDGWDLMVAHPPCTYLAVSGSRWLYHPEDRELPTGDRRPHPLYPNRRQDQIDAAEFFLALANAPIPLRAIEQPVSVMSTWYQKPDQIIRPYEFGEDSTKKTCLWLFGLPPLKPTNIISPSKHVSRSGRVWDKWWFDTSLISNLKERAKVRSTTFLGIAEAMADQWGELSGT